MLLSWWRGMAWWGGVPAGVEAEAGMLQLHWNWHDTMSVVWDSR